MPRSLSPRARTAIQSRDSTDATITLVTITHPDLPDPLRLSSDATERLSIEPFIEGTRSKLTGTEIPGGSFGKPVDFLFVLMEPVLPDDPEEGAPQSDIVFENVDADMVALVRSLTSPATVHFSIVLKDSPDFVDFEWTGLRTVSASYDETTVTLSVSREDHLAYAWPFGRMTKSRFPGQHR